MMCQDNPFALVFTSTFDLMQSAHLLALTDNSTMLAHAYCATSLSVILTVPFLIVMRVALMYILKKSVISDY